MTNQSTIDKLIEMRLTAMADAFRNQTDDPAFKEVPFEDRIYSFSQTIIKSNNDSFSAKVSIFQNGLYPNFMQPS